MLVHHRPGGREGLCWGEAIWDVSLHGSAAWGSSPRSPLAPLPSASSLSPQGSFMSPGWHHFAFPHGFMNPDQNMTVFSKHERQWPWWENDREGKLWQKQLEISWEGEAGPMVMKNLSAHTPLMPTQVFLGFQLPVHCQRNWMQVTNCIIFIPSTH